MVNSDVFHKQQQLFDAHHFPWGDRALSKHGKYKRQMGAVVERSFYQLPLLADVQPGMPGNHIATATGAINVPTNMWRKSRRTGR